LAVDLVYTLQELVAGEVPDTLSLGHARRLVELWALHSAVSAEDDGWATDAVEALSRGTEAMYVDHGVIRRADPRGERPLAGLIALQQLTFASPRRPDLLEWSVDAVEAVLAPCWRA
jgi:hypothetical protein